MVRGESCVVWLFRRLILLTLMLLLAISQCFGFNADSG
jgi:hypothetical protein